MNLIAQHKSVRSLSVFFFLNNLVQKKNIKIDGKWTKWSICYNTKFVKNKKLRKSDCNNIKIHGS